MAAVGDVLVVGRAVLFRGRILLPDAVEVFIFVLLWLVGGFRDRLMTVVGDALVVGRAVLFRRRILLPDAVEVFVFVLLWFVGGFCDRLMAVVGDVLTLCLLGGFFGCCQDTVQPLAVVCGAGKLLLAVALLHAVGLLGIVLRTLIDSAAFPQCLHAIFVFFVQRWLVGESLFVHPIQIFVVRLKYVSAVCQRLLFVLQIPVLSRQCAVFSTGLVVAELPSIRPLAVILAMHLSHRVHLGRHPAVNNAQLAVDLVELILILQILLLQLRCRCLGIIYQELTPLVAFLCGLPDPVYLRFRRLEFLTLFT